MALLTHPRYTISQGPEQLQGQEEPQTQPERTPAALTSTAFDIYASLALPALPCVPDWITSGSWQLAAAASVLALASSPGR